MSTQTDIKDTLPFDPVFLHYGMEVLPYEYVDRLRNDKEARKKMIAPNKGSQEKVLASDSDLIIHVGLRGSGKCQPVDSLVCTPYGFKRMGDIKVGDRISDTNGQSQYVIRLNEKGLMDVYKLKFIDGAEAECTLDHLWNVRKSCCPSKIKNKPFDGVEYFNGKVMTTEQIIEFLDRKERKEKSSYATQNLIIPLSNPIQFSRPVNANIKLIDPYLMGLLLGDGSFAGSDTRVRFTTIDKEISDYIISCSSGFKAHPCGIDFSSYDPALIDHLKMMGLMRKTSIDKFIPEQYKYLSVDQRKSLLQGLLDTDGTVDKTGSISFCSISIQLAKDVQWLIWSLGGKATMRVKKAGYTKEGVYVPCNDAYELYINTSFNSDLFRLNRKKERCIDEFNGGVSEIGRRIIGYEYLGKKECRCIAVSNVNSLYITDDFVVTHNSAVLCMNGYQSIENPEFTGMLFRREINDAKDTGGIADVSKTFYRDFGNFLGSAQNMTWNFRAGGSLKFGYYSDGYDDFVTRLRGKGVSYIGVDELTQMKYRYFRFLFSNNRSAKEHGLKNQILGACNPDGDSWVYRFVGGKYISEKGGKPRYKWLDDEGFPIKEMDGKELYFYLYGERVDQVYWGETKTEVVNQARKEMERLVDPIMQEKIDKGETTLEDLYVMSCTFVTSYTSENQSLDQEDYLKRIAALSPEERERDLGGRWVRRTNSDTLIDMDDMEAFYNNSHQTDSELYVTADISYGDKKDSDPSVFFLWRGFHLEAIEYCRVGTETLKAYTEQYLQKWGVSEENFCFDATGIGSGMNERFTNSMQCDYRTKAFDQREAQIGKMKQNVSSYENVKAQCYDNFANRMKARGYSVNNNLLYSKIDGKMLIDHFNEEYVAIARDRQKDGKFQALAKKEVISMIGHSPNFMDAFWQREYVELVKNNNKRKAKRKNLWLV